MTENHSTGDPYQRTTDRIIAALEEGTVPWIKPWRGATSAGLPTNLCTGKEYQGINVLTLWCAGVHRGFEHDLWLTYRQAQEKGWQVRKGARSETIVKVGQVVKDEGSEDERTFSFLRSYHVFNVAEVEGAPLPVVEDLADHERIEKVEALILASDANVLEGGDRAMYVASRDAIHLPPLGRFESPAYYYSTILHELTHWTGAKTRLDRQFGKRFGDDAYAAEELVAEMGSAFLCAHLGIEGHLQHAEYLGHWLRILNADKRAIFTAAAKASQAATYLRGEANHA